jgi:hypothetical protein
VRDPGTNFDKIHSRYFRTDDRAAKLKPNSSSSAYQCEYVLPPNESLHLVATFQNMNLKLWQRSAVFLLLMSCSWGAFAQQESTTEADPPAEVAEPNASPQERTVYIPFSKLKDVFEKEGRGVFLPYDQFKKLWDEAQQHKNAPPVPLSPLDSIITSAINEATVQRDVVQVEATLTIDLIKEGWLQVPLRLKDSAIQSATIDGETARITPAVDGGYQLLIENDAKEGKSIELKLTYSRSFSKSPGRNSVSFESPQAPVNRWRIRVPQEGVKVNVQPMIAASDADEVATDDGTDEATGEDGADSDPSKDAEEETVLLAFVGAAPQVTIDWTPKSEGARGMTALTAVQVQQEMFISEGTIRTRANIRYEISRGELSELSVQVPSDHKVVNVFDANIRKWSVADEGNSQRILIELFEPATSAQALLIELEQFADLAKSKSIRAPSIRVEEVGRQQGTLVVSVDPALKAESTSRTGLLQIDAAELPPGQAGQAWAFAYRYATIPFELELSVEKIEPKISVNQLVESYLEPELWHLDLLAVYQIEEAGVFELSFQIPQGFEVYQVRGRELPEVAAAAVDTFHVTGDAKDKLVVNLARKAIGRIALQIQLQKRLNDANLLTPTGTTSTLTLDLPQIDPTGIFRAEGRFVLHSPESLRLNPASTTGLRATSFTDAYQNLTSVRDNRFPTTRPSLAFAFTEQKAQVVLNAERRKSYITARQRLIARGDSGVVKYETRIVYDVLYSGVKSLRIDVPASIAAELRNTSGGLRETPILPAPDDVAEGYIAWSITGETELIGQQIVQFTWERKLEQLEVGKSVEWDVPHLKPMNVDRAWGQIVLTKTESIDVQPSGEPTGLRSIDPTHDVMPDAQVADAARAFEFYDDWSLKLTATRFQLEEVKRTSIERAVVRVVVTRSDQQGVQAIYRLRSARQRLALSLPAEAEFDSQPARINGQPVPLERGEQGQLFVPLLGQEPNTPFQLELRYSLPGNHSKISVPAFPEDPAIQKVYLAVYLPAEQTLVGSSGPWTEEYTWNRINGFRWFPAATKSESELLSWLSEGGEAAPPSLFQTDGTMYLFSALRPQPPPDGNLILRTIGERWLAFLAFLPLILIGLGMLRSSFKSKVMAVATVVIVLILCGAFLPTFAQQIFCLPLFAGLLLVGVIWAAWYLTACASCLAGWLPWSANRNQIDAATVPSTPPSESQGDAPGETVHE